MNVKYKFLVKDIFFFIFQAVHKTTFRFMDKDDFSTVKDRSKNAKYLAIIIPSTNLIKKKLIQNTIH